MRYLLGTALAAGLWLVLGSANWASAQDTVRLGGPSAQEAIGDTDTELVHRRYGYYGGGYRGGYYGGYGVRFASPYFSAGYYSRPYYGGYHRPYYGGYYRPYYASYYRPYYSYPSYYYGASYYSPYYYYPCAGDAEMAPEVLVQRYQPPQTNVPPMPPADSGNGTFPYDGGPRSPIPMPNANPAPAPIPNGIVPVDGRLVSMPTQISGGFSQVGVAPQPPASTSPARFAYPAYGDEPIPMVPRKR